MEVLLDQKTTLPLLLGAALALLGGVLTQFIFWRVSLSHSRRALLSAFRAELKVIRENLGTSLAGYRLSLRDADPPTPTTFVIPTPIFSANAGHLGQLRDSDLVEHVAEVYGSVASLSEQARVYSGVANATILLRQLNAMHLTATTTHVQVMKLHNRLLRVPPDAEMNLDDVEIESRKVLKDYSKLAEEGKIVSALERPWPDHA